MQKLYKEYKKAQKTAEADIEPLSEILGTSQQQSYFKRERELSMEEKKYLLAE